MYKFTSGEIRDLFISMAAVTFAFSIFFHNSFDNEFLYIIPVAFIAVVPGFLFHELAHKFMAIKYGFDAEFKMFVPGLFLALASSYFGIIFAAPGAVHIGGNKLINLKEMGKVAIVGPITNIILAFLFLAISIIIIIMAILTGSDTNYSTNSLLYYLFNIGWVGFMINGSMAALNMLPGGIFDGSKVFDWSKNIWAVVFAVSVIIAIIPYILLYVMG